MKIYKLSSDPFFTEVDKNTLIVGKIGTVGEAKELCRALPNPSKTNPYPGPGHETLVDSGTVGLAYSPTSSPTKPMTYRQDDNGIPKRYKTYLQNNSGSFRVWTWIEV